MPLKNNYNIRLVFLLSVLLFIYFLLRIAFYSFNTGYFNDIATAHLVRLFFVGLKFDLSAIFTLNIFFIFCFLLPIPYVKQAAYTFFLKILFLILNIFAIFLAVADFVYFKFINTRTSAEIFHYLGMSKDILYLLPQFLKDFWYLVIIAIFIIYGIWKILGIIFNGIAHTPKKSTFYIGRSISLLIWIGVSIIFMRGGFQLRPINIASASKYTNAKNISLVINTPFNIIKTFNKDRLKEAQYFESIEVAEKIYSPIHHFQSNDGFRSKNIVLIILESFSKEYIGGLQSGSKQDYCSYTPFLDSIIEHAYVFENAYANGKRSIDATVSILAGIPNLMNSAFILSAYAANNINSLAGLLKRKGYYSAFYHGGTNGTMGFDNFANLAEFDAYIGRREYNNDSDFDGKWGIYDEPFLQYVVQQLDNTHPPFFSLVFTLSSHHPYTIPEKYKNKFPKGTLDIHESIGYADYSLKRFFETAAQKEWFENTLFVFTADHTAEVYYPENKTKTGMYAVPIIFYEPHSDLIGRSKKTVQHTDIMPGVLSLLNFNDPFIAFGHDLFDNQIQGISVNYADNIYQLIYDNYVLFFDGEKSISLFEVNSDVFMTKNIIDTIDQKMLREMEQLLKAYIQSYQHRMINNKLTI